MAMASKKVALALNAMHRRCAALAVASMEEAIQLRTLGLSTPILLLSGFRDKVEMDLLSQ